MFSWYKYLLNEVFPAVIYFYEIYLLLFFPLKQDKFSYMDALENGKIEMIETNM